MQRQLGPQDERSFKGDAAPVPAPEALSTQGMSGLVHLPHN